MIMIHLKHMKDKYRFAFWSTILAFIIGFICYQIPISSEHIYFFLSLPIATFIPCCFIWKLTFKSPNDYKVGNVVMIGLILTIICHYLNFVVLGLGRLLCNSLTGGCTDYTGPKESILGILTYETFLRMLISLYKLGLITWIIFIIIGIYVIKTTKSTIK
jgi:hypothetical protein